MQRLALVALALVQACGADGMAGEESFRGDMGVLISIMGGKIRSV